jgi:N-acetylglucosaminyl-diphospho-decaprenol L-rhamnosyltransferase
MTGHTAAPNLALSSATASGGARRDEAVRPGSDPTLAVIIVTFDSGRVLSKCLESLAQQTRQPDLVVVVDNCSPHPAYLEVIPKSNQFNLLRASRNEGFCRGNNLGYVYARRCKYVLFLNPDAFPSSNLLEEALSWMQQPENSRVGCLTGTLLRFDTRAGRPTGRIDTTGIFQTWYGRWYERYGGQVRETVDLGREAHEVTAATGALMFCRTEALERVALHPGEVFDSRFFMYKEDIDLSLRLRAGGWRVVYLPSLVAYHARGWQERSRISLRVKLLAVRNELRICLRYRRWALPFSLAKLAFVVAIEGPLLGLSRLIRGA